MELIEISFQDLHFTSMFWAVCLPIIFCGLDVITGYVNAWIKDEISSKKMREGLGKKVGEITICILGWLTYFALGLYPVAIIFTSYICLMEFTSIAENCDKLGVKMPVALKSKVNNLNVEINEDKKEDK